MHQIPICSPSYWVAVEAVQRVGKYTRFGQLRDQVGQRRVRNIGVVAAVRELLTLVFYGLRDGYIRCLDRAHSFRDDRLSSRVWPVRDRELRTDLNRLACHAWK